MHNLFKEAEIRRLTFDGTNYILAAGTTDVNSGSVDTLGYEGVAFAIAVGVMASSSGVEFQAQYSSDDGSVDTFADIVGSSVSVSADTDDNKLVLLDIFRPKERYVRIQSIRGDGGNTTLDSLVAILYRPLQAAVTQGATVEALETHNSPAEGTA